MANLDFPRTIPFNNTEEQSTSYYHFGARSLWKGHIQHRTFVTAGTHYGVVPALSSDALCIDWSLR